LGSHCLGHLMQRTPARRSSARTRWSPLLKKAVSSWDGRHPRTFRPRCRPRFSVHITSQAGLGREPRVRRIASRCVAWCCPPVRRLRPIIGHAPPGHRLGTAGTGGFFAVPGPFQVDPPGRPRRHRRATVTPTGEKNGILGSLSHRDRPWDDCPSTQALAPPEIRSTAPTAGTPRQKENGSTAKNAKTAKKTSKKETEAS
jgi:hypothetical protein